MAVTYARRRVAGFFHLWQRHLQQASEQVDPVMSGTLCTVQSIKYLTYFADSSKHFFQGEAYQQKYRWLLVYLHSSVSHNFKQLFKQKEN